MTRLLSAMFVSVVCASACGTAPAAPVRGPGAEPSGALDPPSLEAWLRWRFPREVASGALVLDYGRPEVAADVFDELRAYGVTDVAALAALVPFDFERRAAAVFRADGTTIAGLVRDFMIIRDPSRYATRAYKATWCGCDEDFVAAKAYGVDLNALGEAGVFACCDPEGGG